MIIRRLRLQLPAAYWARAVDVLGLLAPTGQAPRLFHLRLRQALNEYRIARHRYRVVNPLGLQIIEHLEAGKAAIKSHQHPGIRERRAQLRQDPAQQTDDAQLGIRIASTQQTGKQVLFRLRVDCEASAGHSIGSRPASSLCIGSSASHSASLQFSWPQAMPSTL